MRDPNNPPTARTGAPGETTCGASGCHSGGTYTGSVTISGVPDTIVANQSYTVNLTNTSNAIRAGFELTCLDNSNAKCGTLSTGSGTSRHCRRPAVCSAINAQKPEQRQHILVFYLESARLDYRQHGHLLFCEPRSQRQWKKYRRQRIDRHQKCCFVAHSRLARTRRRRPGQRVSECGERFFAYRPVERRRRPAYGVRPARKVIVQTTLVQNNQLDISGLGKGILFARIESDGKSLVKKFIVE